MPADMLPVAATSGKSSFIEQTKAARQEREKERKVLESSIKLQSAARGFVARSLLRKQVYLDIDSFLAQQSIDSSNDGIKNIENLPETLFKLIRRFMFNFRRDVDRERFENICRYLLTNMLCPPDSKISADGDSDTTGSEARCYAVVAFQPKNGVAWIHQVKQILSASSDFLKRVHGDSSADEQKSISLHLNVLVTFTAPQNWPLMQRTRYAPLQPVALKLGNNFLNHLVSRGLMPNLNILLTKTLVRRRSIITPAQLSAALSMALRPLVADKFSESIMSDFLVHILSIPGLVLSLDTVAPDSLKALLSHSILKNSLDLLHCESHCRILFNTLEANYALCLMANLVHLASLDDDALKKNLPLFVHAMTRLLECCQQYVVNKQSNLTHWHPLLGWFSQSIDTSLQDTMGLVRTQLKYLWSVEMCSALFSPLFNATKEELAQDREASSPDQENSSQGIDRKDSVQNPSGARPINAFLQKAVDKMNKLNIPKMNISSTSVSSGPISASTVSPASVKRLGTEEAMNIALVCNLYSVAVNTLTQVRLDILTALSFQDLILNNLWRFIRSLSAQNGLKAFLDYLALHSKWDSPQFQILILFCDCTSHVIAILDDFEFYTQQKPFSLEQLVEISTFLNHFVFRLVWNQFIDIKSIHSNILLSSTHNLLLMIYRRDSRRSFCPPDHWLIKDMKTSTFMRELEGAKRVAQVLLQKIPHIIPHKDRVILFRKWVLIEKNEQEVIDSVSPQLGHSTLITIHRSRIVEDGYQQLALLPGANLKGIIRVRFINELGVDEAGIDQHGVFKEFLEETMKRVFDPSLNLFAVSTEERLYPSATSAIHENHLSLFEFVGKMLAKAVYEGIVVDVPFANFFLSQVLGQTSHSALYSSIDELPSLDPDLYKNLTYIKHYDGDVEDLGLTFSLDEDYMGRLVNFELIPGGKSIPVTKDNRISYIHHVAHFRMVRQIHDQTSAFIRGFRSVVNPDWLSIFSAPEFQRLISGDCVPLDLQDLRRHTQYFGGFHSNHRVIKWLWDILENDLSRDEHERFLKFVTSCSKPPVLGFAHLAPPFSIRCVEVADDQDQGDTVGSVLRGFFTISRRDPVNRLPTSSTCFNLLKLPNYQKKSTLREKLKYAINSSTGFELS